LEEEEDDDDAIRTQVVVEYMSYPPSSSIKGACPLSDETTRQEDHIINQSSLSPLSVYTYHHQSFSSFLCPFSTCLGSTGVIVVWYPFYQRTGVMMIASLFTFKESGRLAGWLLLFPTCLPPHLSIYHSASDDFISTTTSNAWLTPGSRRHHGGYANQSLSYRIVVVCFNL